MKISIKLSVIIVLALSILNSCQPPSSNNGHEVEILHDQIDELKKENDSLKSVIESEKFGAFLLADGYDGFSTSKTEMNLILSLTYSRNDLISQIRYSVFTNKDSLEKAFNENSLSESMIIFDNDNTEFNGSVEFRVEHLEEGLNYVGGQFFFSEESERRPLPFQYTILKK